MFLHRLWQRKLLRLLVVILVTLAGFAAIILLISFGYQADWTGFNKHIEPVLAGQQELPAKTLWDWMQLLIVPVMLAGGALWFNHTMSQKDQKLTTQRYENEQKIAAQRYENDQKITAQRYENEQKIAAQRYENDQKIATQRYENDQKIALDKQREDLLQIYLDRMSELLLKENLRTSQPEQEVRNVARARTLSVFGQLDTARKNAVLSFLREAELVTPEAGKSIVTFRRANLVGADLRSVHFYHFDLSEASLSGAKLNEADLSGTNLRKTDLNEADLSGANLRKADLSGATLVKANFSKTTLRGANLSEANLSEAVFRNADLSFANLSFANLMEADLSGAILFKTDLNGANLSGAIGITRK